MHPLTNFGGGRKVLGPTDLLTRGTWLFIFDINLNPHHLDVRVGNLPPPPMPTTGTSKNISSSDKK